MDAIATDKHLSIPSTSTDTSEAPGVYEYTVLNRTFFKYEKQRFLAGVDEIKKLRLPEYLCRFVPLEKKTQMLERFNEQLGTLIKAFDKMKCQAADFRKLYDVEAKLRRDKSMEYSQFYSFICAEIRQVGDSWKELFEQGSMQSLPRVLQVIGLGKTPRYHQHSYDVGSWMLSMQNMYSGLHVLEKHSVKGAQKKAEGACCKWR